MMCCLNHFKKDHLWLRPRCVRNSFELYGREPNRCLDHYIVRQGRCYIRLLGIGRGHMLA